MNQTPTTNVDRFRVATVAIVCLTLVGLAAVGEVLAGKKETLTITGTIKAAEMRSGKIRAVFIDDTEHGEFIVQRGTDVAKKLLKQIGATIRATGYVGEAVREQAFANFIDILEYEVVAPPAADEEPTN